ncbi:N-acetylmuramoyl-L-alanine amidase [Kitasatospora sp. NBC_00085]|uniref:N-acetylmuramoyl-L-alanine amidase n=1 Tax=unclassified Kitasatospora TaxID=2633591 RepID=UPI00324DA331
MFDPRSPRPCYLDYTAGRTVANGVTTETTVVQGSDGAVWFRNNAGFTHLLVDATGYFTTG